MGRPEAYRERMEKARDMEASRLRRIAAFEEDEAALADKLAGIRGSLLALRMERYCLMCAEPMKLTSKDKERTTCSGRCRVAKNRYLGGEKP